MAIAVLSDLWIEGATRLAALADPAPPAADRVLLYGKKVGGRMMAAQMGPAGIDTTFQPNLGGNRVSMWTPVGSGTTIDAINGVGFSSVGALTAAAIDQTNVHRYLRRVDWLIGTASASAVAGYRHNGVQQSWNLGCALPQLGGFHYRTRWGPATGAALATGRAFTGLSAAGVAPTDVDPSGISNQVGMGWDAGDVNAQIIVKGTGAAVKVDLGPEFPKAGADRARVYELAMFAPPGPVQSLGWSVLDLSTGAFAEGEITTGLPLVSAGLGPRGWVSVGGTSSVIGYAFMGLYIETDL